MNPQGSAVINEAYFAALIATVARAGSCTELVVAYAAAIASLNAANIAIASQLAAVTPILALLSAPAANPAAIVTWIETFISSFLTPLAKPAVTLAAQQVSIATATAALTAAAAAKAATFPSCSL